MSERKPLMPKATAVWLVDNTGLTFDQIAVFCGLHVLEVKGIADGDVASGIKGLDPISSGQLTREEIKRAEEDPARNLKIAEPKVVLPPVTNRKKGPRYTPVSRRQDRPNAVLWLLKSHPELKDAQIIRLVGTTKPTIAQIRDRTHWNSPNLQPQDPVTLGLCTQIDLDAEVQKAATRLEKERKDAGIELEPAGSLLPTAETTDYAIGVGGLITAEDASAGVPKVATDAEEEARMFEKLQSMSGSEDVEGDGGPVETAEDVFRAQPAGEAAPENDAEDGSGDETGAPDNSEATAQAEETAEDAEGEVDAGPEADGSKA